MTSTAYWNTCLRIGLREQQQLVAHLANISGQRVPEVKRVLPSLQDPEPLRRHKEDSLDVWVAVT